MTSIAGYGLLFANLEKFNGDNIDLVPWLRQFDRLCIAGKLTFEAVKGQLLMIFVDGQAKAVLESYEEQEMLSRNTQNYERYWRRNTIRRRSGI